MRQGLGFFFQLRQHGCPEESLQLPTPAFHAGKGRPPLWWDPSLASWVEASPQTFWLNASAIKEYRSFYWKIITHLKHNLSDLPLAEVVDLDNTSTLKCTLISSVCLFVTNPEILSMYFVEQND